MGCGLRLPRRHRGRWEGPRLGPGSAPPGLLWSLKAQAARAGRRPPAADRPASLPLRLRAARAPPQVLAPAVGCICGAVRALIPV